MTGAAIDLDRLLKLRLLVARLLEAPTAVGAVKKTKKATSNA
jgi:hypothetical protein